MFAISAPLLMILVAQPFRAAGDQAPPRTATATLRGHVIAGDTGQPLRKAQVRLTFNPLPTDPPPAAEHRNRAATTDADGNYEFAGLTVGRYLLFISKPGYIGVAWGQDRSGPGKPIDVAAGQTVDHVDFALQRGGVITGRIFDEFGEPLSGIQVSAIRRQQNGAQGDRIQMASGQTNDLGEFRIYGIAPGQYYVQTTWRRIGPGDPTSPDRTGYPTTFFPGTTDAGAAQRFTIAAGQTIGDLAMALSPIKTVRIEGIAVDSSDRPLANASLTIVQDSGPATSGFVSSGAGIRPDGTFVFTNVTPGAYALRLQTMDDRKQVATMKLSVGTEDITGVRLVASPPSTISGRIVIDPAQAALLPTTAFSVIASATEPSLISRFGAQPVRVADDLTFELTAPVGRHAINVTNLPAGWSIRSLRVNNIDVTDDGIEVKPNDRITGVEVELTNKVTAISGIVTDDKGAPAKNCWIVVFPADNKRWAPNSRYKRAQRSGQDGRFGTTGLPPGDYYIIALDTMEAPQSSDPDFLERIRVKSTSFSLREGETQRFDLKLNSPQ
jgi:hypothetical protein